MVPLCTCVADQTKTEQPPFLSQLAFALSTPIMPPKKDNKSGKGAKGGGGGGQKEDAAGKEKKGNSIKVFLMLPLTGACLVLNSPVLFYLGPPHSVRKTIKGFRSNGEDQSRHEI